MNISHLTFIRVLTCSARSLELFQILRVLRYRSKNKFGEHGHGNITGRHGSVVPAPPSVHYFAFKPYHVSIIAWSGKISIFNQRLPCPKVIRNALIVRFMKEFDTFYDAKQQFRILFNLSGSISTCMRIHLFCISETYSF